MPHVGFWKEAEYLLRIPTPHLPEPHVNKDPQPGQEELLFQLSWIEARLWDLHYTFVKQYNAWGAARDVQRARGERPIPEQDDLSKPDWQIVEQFIRGYRGSSRCRLCDQSNGSYEYELDGWIWPEGYMHYLRDHNVTPNEEFRQWALKKTF